MIFSTFSALVIVVAVAIAVFIVVAVLLWRAIHSVRSTSLVRTHTVSHSRFIFFSYSRTFRLSYSLPKRLSRSDLNLFTLST